MKLTKHAGQASGKREYWMLQKEKADLLGQLYWVWLHRGKIRIECVICSEETANESMKPCRLKWHQATQTPWVQWVSPRSFSSEEKKLVVTLQNIKRNVFQWLEADKSSKLLHSYLLYKPNSHTWFYRPWMAFVPPTITKALLHLVYNCNWNYASCITTWQTSHLGRGVYVETLSEVLNHSNNTDPSHFLQ